MSPNQAGYQYLLAYKLTVPIYDYTVEFCNRCAYPNYPKPPDSPYSPNFPKLSSSRTFDQMVQAARSGLANIAEGYQQKSLASYIKLVGVSIGSLEELLKDYQAYARQHRLPIWDKSKSREIRELGAIWAILKSTPTLPNSPNFPHLPKSPEIAVNLMITLTNQALYLLQKLNTSLETKHTTEGGFSENLLKKRLNYRKQHPYT